jgi:hypothetical protein
LASHQRHFYHIEKNDQYGAQDPIHAKAHWMQTSFVMTAPDQEDLEDLRGLFAEQHPDWEMSIETKDNQYQLKGSLPQIKFTKITKAWYYQLLGFLQHYAVEFMCQLMPVRIVLV